MSDSISTQQAAVLLGVTKQGVHRMIRAGHITDVDKIGNPEGQQIYVLSRKEIQALAAKRAKESQ